MLAISLPSVLGDAGWPCVRDSKGTLAFSRASSVNTESTFRSCGKSTSSRAPRNIKPCEVLLISSEVQAKWMNSLAFNRSERPATFSFKKYSTALTSWLVTASISLMRWASASEKFCGSESKKASSAVLILGTSGRPAAANANNQWISTNTRWRIKAASESQGRRASSLLA